MKKKILLLFILTIALISFKTSAATYNFNFYNNEKEEVEKNTLPTNSATVPNETQIIPLAPATPLSSNEIAEQKVEEIKESLLSLGYFHYRRRGSDSLSLHSSIEQISGQGLRIGAGKKGGLKGDIEIIAERGLINYKNSGFSNRNHSRTVSGKFKASGLGLNLKKEFMIKNNLGFELGVGGNYLKGKNDASGLNGRPRNEMITDYSYYGQFGINFYYKQVSLNLSGRLAKSEMTAQYDTKYSKEFPKDKIKNTTPVLLAGISFHF